MMRNFRDRRSAQLWASVVTILGIAACGRASFEVPDAPSDAASAPPIDSSVDAGPDRPNVAFVTSTYYKGNIGVPTVVDAICQSRAVAAGLDGEFIAWIKGSARPDPSVLLMGSSGWRTLGGEWIANTRQQLVLEQYFNPLLRTETNLQRSDAEAVWKGALSKSCLEWSALSVEQTAVIKSVGRWGDPFDFISTCEQDRSIACFERGHNATRPVPQRTNRLAFASKDRWMPNPLGRQDADDFCQLEASAAALTGTFVALLPMQGQTAISRINAAASTVFQRTDGEMIGSLSSLATFIMLDAKGNPSPGFV
jgi:hypothetical protein